MLLLKISLLLLCLVCLLIGFMGVSAACMVHDDFRDQR